MIKLNDLAIGYNGEAILEHIDQEFDDGLIYGILAKSGAGKTTLLKTIAGLLRRPAGRGSDLAALPVLCNRKQRCAHHVLYHRL